VLRGCVLSRVEPAAVTTRELTTQQEWYAALADVFGLTLDDVSSQERAALWRRVRAADEQWAANA
jgi:hypothetical protein